MFYFKYFVQCFSVESDQPKDDQRGNAKEPRAASGTIKLYFYIFFKPKNVSSADFSVLFKFD